MRIADRLTETDATQPNEQADRLADPLADPLADRLADREALSKIANVFLQRISPLVAIEPEPLFCGLASNQPQTLLLDITGIGDWFGDEPTVLLEADSVLADHGLQAKMSIADSSAAAWAMARFGRERIALLETGAMLCTVGALPVRALRLDEQTAHQLDRLGLRCIADVLQLPREGLAARLGSELLRRIDELTGQIPQTLSMHHAEVEESATCVLEYPTDDRDILQHRLCLLVDNVSVNLVTRRRGALRLTCRFEMTEHSPETLEIGLFVPTSDASHLSRLCVQAMERKQFAGLVERLTLSVTLGGPLQQYQQMMFGDDSISQVTTRRSLGRMIETLAGRLGRDAVVGIESSRNPLPEAAFRPRPLAGESRSTLLLGKRAASRSSSHRKSRSPASDPAFKSPRQTVLPPALGPLVSDPLRRPLRIFSEPKSIEVIELGSAGVPQRIRVENRIYEVTRHWGPERIETGWWDGPQIRRDYYRIEIKNGSWWWIFRQLSGHTSDAWKLHGQFT